jgi:hypothetical protein
MVGDKDRAAGRGHKRRPLGPVFTFTWLRLLPRCDGARNRGGRVMAKREARQPWVHV